jgi:GDP-L-fucose synthase
MDNQFNNKVLLTGGSGMVGRNVRDHPKSKNWRIFSPTSNELDLTDYGNVLKYIKKIKPGIIIHAAGRVGGINANLSNPVDFLVQNLDIGRNLILAARDSGVIKLLNLGSSCMYPRNAKNPLSEDLILKGELEPTNEGYAIAKIMAARLCEYINYENSKFQYKTIIPCNVYGKYDKFDLERSHLVPAIINKLTKAAAEGLEEVEIWGDGKARREFMYAGDLADAIFCALEDFNNLPKVLNIGIGEDHTINDYYSVVAKVIGYKGEFNHNLEKPVGMLQKLLDVKKQTKWGWKPRTSLYDGVLETYNYYISQKSEN